MGKASRGKAEQRALRQAAARAAAEVGSPLILWGIPGAGKSTLARWLVGEKGFEHIDNDVVATKGATTPLERTWAHVGQDAELFIAAAANHPRPVVVEFGMYANAGGIALLNRLRELGAEPWWFDGDRAAAKDAWREENRKGRRNFEDAKWNAVVEVVEANWRQIEDFLGERVLRTIEAGRRHVAPAATYRRMAAIRARAN